MRAAATPWEGELRLHKGLCSGNGVQGRWGLAQGLRTGGDASWRMRGQRGAEMATTAAEHLESASQRPPARWGWRGSGACPRPPLPASPRVTLRPPSGESGWGAAWQPLGSGPWEAHRPLVPADCGAPWGCVAPALLLGWAWGRGAWGRGTWAWRGHRALRPRVAPGRAPQSRALSLLPL